MQFIRLIGVLDDGTDIRPRVPRHSAKTIQLPLLSDVTIEVEVVNNQGVAVELSTSSPTFNSWLTIVQNPDSCEQASGKVDFQLASTTVKLLTRNIIVFAITKSALRRFPAGRYFYDVSLDFSSVKYQIVRISGLHLEPALRRA